MIPETEEEEVNREFGVQEIKTKYQNFRITLEKNKLSKAMLTKSASTADVVPLPSIVNSVQQSQVASLDHNVEGDGDADDIEKRAESKASTEYQSVLK